MTIDLSLKNENLWCGCLVGEVAGRSNLVTPVAEAVGIVGRNIHNLLNSCSDRREVTLTGPAPIWAYLVVFHAVVHTFNRVYYCDGRNQPVLVAAHGA